MTAGDNPLCLILHNIRSCHNVGSIFRTAEAAGVKKIYLTGYTPAPLDRFGRAVKEIVKTALGAEKTVGWEQFARIRPLLKKLKDDGYKLVALEQSARSVDYRKVKLRGPTAVILGNEVRGLPKQILDKCDMVAEIPMRGKMVRHAHHPRNMRYSHPERSRGKESLNVSVACGIALFHWLD